MWSEPPLSSGLVDEHELYYTAPHAKYLELTMAFLDTQAVSHNWITYDSGSPLIGPSGFNWYRYTPNQEQFVPSTTEPFKLVNSRLDSLPFWQHMRAVVDFCNTRWLISHSGNKGFATQKRPFISAFGNFVNDWHIPEVSGMLASGRIHSKDYFDCIVSGYQPLTAGLDYAWFAGKKTGTASFSVNSNQLPAGRYGYWSAPRVFDSGIPIRNVAWDAYQDSDWGSAGTLVVNAEGDEYKNTRALGPGQYAQMTYSVTESASFVITLTTTTTFSTAFNFTILPLARFDGVGNSYPAFPLESILTMTSGYLARVEVPTDLLNVAGNGSGLASRFDLGKYYGEFYRYNTPRYLVCGTIKHSGGLQDGIGGGGKHDVPVHTISYSNSSTWFNILHMRQAADKVADKISVGDYKILATMSNSTFPTGFFPTQPTGINYGDMNPIVSGYDDIITTTRWLREYEFDTWAKDISDIYTCVPSGEDNFLFIADFFYPLEYSGIIPFQLKGSPSGQPFYAEDDGWMAINQYYASGVGVVGRDFHSQAEGPDTEVILYEAHPEVSGQPEWTPVASRLDFKFTHNKDNLYHWSNGV